MDEGQRLFLGEYSSALDEKRRLYLPKKVRYEIGSNKFILTRGYEKCVFGWRMFDWEESNKKNLDKPITEQEARDIRRFIFSGAQISAIDRLGRTIIPEHLSTHASLREEVILIGAGDHFEIWNKALWQIYLKGLGE